MRGIVRGIGSVKVGGASYCSSRPLRALFRIADQLQRWSGMTEIWVLAIAQRVLPLAGRTELTR